MHFASLVIILTTIFLSSTTSLHPVFKRPTPCPPAPHVSPFPYLIILPTCPPPTQPVTSEDEEELFTCPGTGTFPTTQDCNSFYLCSVTGEVRQLGCVRVILLIYFQVQKDMWKCPRGTLFSQDLGVCDFQWNVACS